MNSLERTHRVVTACLVALMSAAVVGCPTGGLEDGDDAGSSVHPPDAEPEPTPDTAAPPEPPPASADASIPPYPDAAEPAAELVHFQVNIEWTVDDMGETTFHRRILEKRSLPDIISAQELWPTPLCGRERHRGAEARDTVQACAGDGYGRTSFMGLLERHTGRSWDVRHIADHANAVIWDEERFAHVASDQWRFGQTRALRAACCGGSSEAGCASTDLIGMAVLLRDSRRTDDPADDVLVSVASVHTGGYGSACVGAHLRRADAIFDDWEVAHDEHPLARRFVSGDLNTRPDTNSATAADRRREETPACWWRSFTRNHSCGGVSGRYFDAVWITQYDGASNNRAAICSQWTFPMNSGGADRCDHIMDSAGQVYQRIDYTFVDGLGLNRSRIRSHVDKGYFDRDGDGRFDFGEAYSDSHRGIYTEVDYTLAP